MRGFGDDGEIRGDVPEAQVSRAVTVRGYRMHYVESGEGRPILFIHGNPTSSYLWRSVIPHLSGRGRSIAVDLIGMGLSEKPSTGYRLVDHVAFIDEFIEALGLEDLTFVLHDWGVSLGLHYLARYPGRVRAVAFMEGHLRPYGGWEDFDEGAQEMFKALRSDDPGRRMVLEENFFVETVLPMGTLRELSEREMEAYRAPYATPEDRWPTLQWAREIPIGGDPADVHDIVDGYRTALVDPGVPKLLLYATPGALIGASEVAWCQEAVGNLSVAHVGDGLHFLPEDRPHEIGRAVARWLDAIDDA